MFLNERLRANFQRGNAHRMRYSLTKPICQIFGNEQGGMPVRALFRHLHVGHPFLRVDHRNAFLTSFLSQSGRALDLLHNRGALRYKIFAFFLAELRVIHHRIIQQPAKESCAQAPVPPLFGVGKRFVCHGADPLFG